MSKSPTQAVPLRLALTLGDVAGVGPEVVAKGLTELLPHQNWQTVIVGCPQLVRRSLLLVASRWDVVEIQQCGDKWSREGRLVVWNPTSVAVNEVPIGVADARAGRAAYDWLVSATRDRKSVV